LDLDREVARGWRMHNEELHNLHASQYIIKVTKSSRMMWVGYAACMGEMRNVYKILFRKSEGKRPLGRPRHRWRILLEWILGNQGDKLWTAFIWLSIGTSGKLL
jgi:hypothetical protein